MTDNREAQRLENPADLPPEASKRAAAALLGREGYALGADELSLQRRVAIFRKHFDHLAQIPLQFIQRLSLRMRSGESGHVPDIITSLGTALDDRGE